METNDATEELIETSDAEERELNDTKKSGYYDRLWGAFDQKNIGPGEQFEQSATLLSQCEKPAASVPPKSPQGVLSRIPIPSARRLEPLTPPGESTSPPHTQHLIQRNGLAPWTSNSYGSDSSQDPICLFSPLHVKWQQTALPPKSVSSNSKVKIPETTVGRHASTSQNVTCSPKSPSIFGVSPNKDIWLPGEEGDFSTMPPDVSSSLPDSVFDKSLSVLDSSPSALLQNGKQPIVVRDEDLVRGGPRSPPQTISSPDHGLPLPSDDPPTSPTETRQTHRSSTMKESVRFTSPLIQSPKEPPPQDTPSLPSQPIRSPPSAVSPEPEPPQGRSYSLRHRSAKQLNPFEYDKRQYRNLLRGMPEAFVKTTLGSKGKDRYQEEGAYSESNGEDAEGDGAWAVRRKWKAKRLEWEQKRAALEATMHELGIELVSSEEDDLPHMEPRTGISGQDVSKSKKRKRSSKTIHPFPMDMQENSEPSLRMNSVPPAESPVLKARPRPRPLGKRPPSPPHLSSINIVREDADFDYNMVNGVHEGGQMSDGRRSSSSLPHAKNGTEEASRLSPARNSGDQAGFHALNRYHGRQDSDSDGSQIRVIENHISEDILRPEGDSETSDEADEMTAKDRKRMKILRRMMPARLIKKLMAQEKDNSRHEAKSFRERQEHEEGECDDIHSVPLQRGRCRKRFVSSNANDASKYAIKGDTDSETDRERMSHDADQGVVILDSDDEDHDADQGVIIIDSDDEDHDEDQENEQDAEQALEESEEGPDDEEIRTWLAQYPGTRTLTSNGLTDVLGRSRSPLDRDRPRCGDLIDRMLQRTRRVGPRVERTSNTTNHKAKERQAKSAKIKTRKPSKVGFLRQTKLSFETIQKAPQTPSNNLYDKRDWHGDKARRHNSLSRSDRNAPDSKRPRKKTSRKRTLYSAKGQALYINKHSGINIISGRPRQAIHIDVDDDMFHNALTPIEVPVRPLPRHSPKTKRQFIQNFREGFLGHPNNDDVFANARGFTPKRSEISLDFDIMPLPSGIKVSSDGYVGKGRLFELMAFIDGTHEVEPPSMFMAFGLQIDPDTPIPDLSSVLASAFDKLYDEAIVPLSSYQDSSSTRMADSIMYTLRQFVTFKALHCKDEEESLLSTIISEQLKHLLRRIDSRLELLSADGHALDFRFFEIYWLSVELHLRLVHARRRRVGGNEVAASEPSHPAVDNATQLLRRLFEYGTDRVVDPLQREGFTLDMSSPNVRVLDMWICLFHSVPHLADILHRETPAPSCLFWSMLETALELQSNQPELQLFKSEHIWRTVFNLCALSQFTVQGIVTHPIRLKPHWPIIKKALNTIRLSADERDNSTPASTLQKRDTYLRIVTARCYLLAARWNWSLVDADDVFHGLCAIFRSRQFSNLLGEPNDFPAFIRNQDEALFHVYQTTDTAYGLFLKLIIRAAKDFNDKDPSGHLRTIKLSRLLSLTVPVGSTSFSKATPPVFQALSMLYNRYSAVFVAIYVDPSDKHIRSRLQQVRRYITFKDADSNSRTAAIRSLLHLATLLQHLDKSLDDILGWAFEMLEDLLSELSQNPELTEVLPSSERDKVMLTAQMLLRTVSTIVRTSGFVSSVKKPPKYPNMVFIRVWLPHLLSGSLVKDHRTGLEICGFIRSFLDAREALLPSPSIPKPDLQDGRQESQDDYGDVDLDLNDPVLLALLDNTEEISDENRLADKMASETMDGLSQPLYTCVCMHLGCRALDYNYDEVDEWLKIWLEYGSVLVRNKRRDWNYYFQLAEAALRDIVDAFRCIHIRMRFATSVLRLDYSIYKSRTEYFVKLWLEAIVSPDITIQPEFSAALFSVDSLKHPLLQDMSRFIEPVSDHFNFERNNFKQRRLEIITTVLHNASFTLRVLETEEFIPYIEVILGSLHKWRNVMKQEHRVLKDYDTFNHEIFSVARSHESIAQHPQLVPYIEAADKCFTQLP